MTSPLSGLEADPRLLDDYPEVLFALAGLRVGRTPEFEPGLVDRLHAFVELVMSCSGDFEPGEAPPAVLMAGNAALTLSRMPWLGDGARLRLRAALLFELADKPMMAAAVVGEIAGPAILDEYFKRSGPFRALDEELGTESSHNGVVADFPLLGALGQQAWDLASFEQGARDTPISETHQAVLSAALHYGLDLNASDVLAFTAATRARARLATRSHVTDELLDDLANGGFPPELWSGQAEAIGRGLLDEQFDAWSFSAPTGTGKTFLARLLILSTLRAHPESKVLYIVPSRALVHEVSVDLGKTLEGLGIEVRSITPTLVALDDQDGDSMREADVLVLTPEKADLLLRIEPSAMEEVSLVVIDEAHHIESGTRGVLLELYLWRLKQLVGAHARFVFMSAVAPNVGDLASWVGKRPSGANVTSRATGMRVGTFELRRPGKFVEGWIRYHDGTELQVIEKKASRGHQEGIAQLAAVLGQSGPVLVVAKGKKTAENIAATFVENLPADADCRLSEEDLASPSIQRLDSRLEREMYADVPLRSLLRAGVAYHHAGLPPRVREAVENAISDRKIRYVFATTTLAEGVNFPFSSVIVQALAIREPPSDQPASWRVVTPRKFWNIAGRAGRAGFDYEGQVILFEPSLGLDHISGPLDPYLESSITSIDPVRSALAAGIIALRERVKNSPAALSSLGEIELPESVPGGTRGFVNLIRTGIAHARASGLDLSASEFFEGTLAAQELESDPATLKFASDLVEQQADVVDRYLGSPGAPTERQFAELGLSMDVLTRLRRFVEEQEDWQFDQIVGALPGGHLRARSLKWFFSGVMSRMAEPEGQPLGGFLADMVVEWSRGIPFAGFAREVQGDRRLEDLIALLYSRVQYLLPWALYAVDRFFAEEANKRDKSYEGQVQQIAYLVDAGVPSFGALRLTHAGFERADATRLDRAHGANSVAKATTDVLAWVAAQSDKDLRQIVRGADRRRIDYDLIGTVDKLRGTPQPNPKGRTD